MKTHQGQLRFSFLQVNLRRSPPTLEGKYFSQNSYLIKKTIQSRAETISGEIQVTWFKKKSFNTYNYVQLSLYGGFVRSHSVPMLILLLPSSDCESKCLFKNIM